MKLIELSASPAVWINIGTGAVSRVCHEVSNVTGRLTATVVMNDGHQICVEGTTLGALVSSLKSQEQNYEKETKA